MNPLDHSLKRLFNAAAQAPSEAPGPLPLPVESRVLAQWRSGADADDSAPLTVFFRRAVICAGLVAGLSIVWSYRENNNAAGNAAAGTLALANYEINLRLPR
jgi:hypothetical protein